MSGDATTLIEQFFASQPDDSDFQIAPRRAPFSFVGPLSDDARFVYATKRDPVLFALDQCDAPCDVGVIARYGLPSRSDVPWLRKITGDCDLYFLGDLDPVDLLTLAWLRAAFEPKTIVHFGVNDSLCEQLHVSIPDSYTIPLSPSEVAALPLLEQVFPDLFDAVGPASAARLRSGCKTEIEAVVSALGSSMPIVELLMRSPKP